MPEILSNVIPRLSQRAFAWRTVGSLADLSRKDLTPDVVRSLFDSLKNGLNDYTIDERGDVGSWVRIACIRGLASFSEILLSNASSLPDFEKYLPSTTYHEALAGILKQGVERLDNVRQEAGESFLRLLRLPLPVTLHEESYRVHGEALLRQLFLRSAFEPSPS